MQSRDFPEFSQDCEEIIEGLKCLREKLATKKGQILLQDLEDQVAETRTLASRSMKMLILSCSAAAMWVAESGMVPILGAA